VPKELIVAQFFPEEQAAIERVMADLEEVTARLAELGQENAGEGGAFADLEKVNKSTVAGALAEAHGATDSEAETAVLREWMELNSREVGLRSRVRAAEAELDAKAYSKYAELTEEDIRRLAVDDKWLGAVEDAVRRGIHGVGAVLTERATELGRRYQARLRDLVRCVEARQDAVGEDLKRMGFVWR
jgi:type I restriction enzyme M protein